MEAFSLEHVRFLGFMLSRDGITVVNDRVKNIILGDPSKNTKEPIIFSGMVNFVARLIPNMSELSSPVRDLL